MVEAEGRRGGTTLTARVSHIIAGRRARLPFSASSVVITGFSCRIELASKESRSVESAFLPAINGKAVGAGWTERRAGHAYSRSQHARREAARTAHEPNPVAARAVGRWSGVNGADRPHGPAREGS